MIRPDQRNTTAMKTRSEKQTERSRQVAHAAPNIQGEVPHESADSARASKFDDRCWREEENKVVGKSETKRRTPLQNAKPSNPDGAEPGPAMKEKALNAIPFADGV
jgi:hypothetical protein